MKKIITTIFQILGFIGIGAIYYYTDSRMGMRRHMVYMNARYESTYHLKTIFIISLIVFIVFLIFYFYKKRRIDFDSIIMILITLAIGLSIFFGKEIFGESFNLISAILVIEGVLQLIKMLGNKEKEDYDYLIK
ncbi:MAG: hypothetical protein SPI59_02890 [Finegoldia sp.]|nr:hypothetical protein [Finegoldia sp.]